VTILKNMTNILTAIGEIYIFRKGQNKKVWAALFLMVCPRSIPVWNAFTLIDDFSLHPELIFLFFCSLQVVSAVCGGITDLSFHLIGYTWQIINCFLTAGYSVS
jgi:GDP-mannose transporter